MPSYVVWFLVTQAHLVLDHTGFVAAMVAAWVGTVVAVADVLASVKMITRLREHGVTTDALVGKVKVHSPSTQYDWSGVHTIVEVSFTDTEGAPIRASYEGRPRGPMEGQTTRIVYDPQRPTSISPLGASGAPDDPRWVGVFWEGLFVVAILAISIYFSLRAFG
jgi:hypothetical protein